MPGHAGAVPEHRLFAKFHITAWQNVRHVNDGELPRRAPSRAGRRRAPAAAGSPEGLARSGLQLDAGLQLSGAPEGAPFTIPRCPAPDIGTASTEVGENSVHEFRHGVFDRYDRSQRDWMSDTGLRFTVRPRSPRHESAVAPCPAEKFAANWNLRTSCHFHQCASLRDVRASPLPQSRGRSM